MDLAQALQSRDLGSVAACLAQDPVAAAQPDARGIKPLTLALYLRFAPAVPLLLQHVEPDGFEAAMLGDSKACVARLANVQAVAPDGFTALHLAAHFGHPATIEALVRAGCPPDVRGAPPLANQPLHAAAAGGQADACRTLLRLGAPVDGRDAGGNTALMVAAAGGQEAVVQVLLDAGAQPAAANRDGKTAFQFAQERGHAGIAALLPT